MESTKITLEKTLSIWWSMTWRIPVYYLGFTIGCMILFITGWIIFSLVVSLSLEPIKFGTVFERIFDWLRHDPVAELINWVVSILASIWALKVALSKPHGGYSVVLVKSLTGVRET